MTVERKQQDIVVGIDCSGESFSVAVLRGEECLAETGGLSVRSHLRLLFPTLLACVGQAGLSLQDVACVAVTNGPGSFTGLRLGVVTARTIAQVTKCSVVGVSTVEALAAGVPGSECVMAGMDARRSEIFAAFFDTRSGLPRRLSEDKAYSATELAAAMRERGCRLAVGSCVAKYGNELQEAGSDVCLLSPILAQPRGIWVARLGRAAWLAGENCPPYELVPVYLRTAEVQVHSVKPC